MDRILRSYVDGRKDDLILEGISVDDGEFCSLGGVARDEQEPRTTAMEVRARSGVLVQ